MVIDTNLIYKNISKVSDLTSNIGFTLEKAVSSVSAIPVTGLCINEAATRIRKNVRNMEINSEKNKSF